MVNLPSQASLAQEQNALCLKEIIRSLTKSISASSSATIKIFALKSLKELIDNISLIKDLNVLDEFQQTFPAIRDSINGEWQGADASEKGKFLRLVSSFIKELTAYGEGGVEIITGNYQVEGTFVPTLIKILMSEDEDVSCHRQTACKCLRACLVVQKGVIISTFRMLDKGSPAQAQKILDAGFLEKIPVLLSSTNAETKGYAMDCIGALLEDCSESRLDMLLEDDFLSSILPTVLATFENSDIPGLKLDSANLLVALHHSAWQNKTRRDQLTEKLSSHGLTSVVAIVAIVFKEHEGPKIRGLSILQALLNM